MGKNANGDDDYIETAASSVKHKQNGHVWIEFLHHLKTPAVLSYAISPDEAPIDKIPQADGFWIKHTDDIQDAFTIWNEDAVPAGSLFLDRENRIISPV